LLTAKPARKKPGDDVRVFFSPAAVVRIEAVDTIEIGPPYGEVAGARALPGVFPESPKSAERKREKGRQPVDAAARAFAKPASGAPGFRSPALSQHARRQCRCKQDAAARHA